MIKWHQNWLIVQKTPCNLPSKITRQKSTQKTINGSLNITKHLSNHYGNYNYFPLSTMWVIIICDSSRYHMLKPWFDRCEVKMMFLRWSPQPSTTTEKEKMKNDYCCPKSMNSLTLRKVFFFWFLVWFISKQCRFARSAIPNVTSLFFNFNGSGNATTTTTKQNETKNKKKYIFLYIFF